MAAIRVLQVFTIMNRGGAESMIMNYYRQLDKDLIQFDFIVHRMENGAFDEEIKSLGGKIFKLNPINPFSPKKYYNELRILLKDIGKDYKIIHSHLNTFSSFPLKIAEEVKIPYRIAHAHIAMDKPALTSIFSGVKGCKEYLKTIVKLNLRKRITMYSTHYFSCGIKAGNWLFGHESDYKLLNNAIDARNFKYDETIAKTYKKTLNTNSDKVFGHIGRFSPQKNHKFLIDVFSEIMKIHSSSKLLLVGDGPLKNEMERYVNQLGLNDSVLFLGVRTDIPNLCMAMDFFVFPSLYEGLPVTLIEAQCSGLKIMASDQITREVELTNNISFESIEISPS